MHNDSYRYPYYYYYPYYTQAPFYYGEGGDNGVYQEREQNNQSPSFRASHQGNSSFKDQGRNPYTVNINEVSKSNNTFRTALWTGKHLQVTLMSLLPGEDIGLEIHPEVDQFLRIEQGQGVVQMGRRKGDLNFVRNVYNDSAIMIPAGTWHNLTNTGNSPLKLYSIYAPPNHPFGTVHRTKAEAIAAEDTRQQRH
ncbi:cupin domain-containing protein [Sediminibacillus halophilus]|uniref:Mannose-6-phosphate isomerase, cupin superfamily n=1 Tax=Sediminibacillus halophilus TaxID=482461 RepID=A0A1G9RZH6_9BACI|nr:cupin domain-containing protein [Sediminibacillus halophilus]SDM28659.1 Mannose-6-phosphate isomerase, cupin superfamily [Sediminibacillus halophilus]